MVRYRFLKEMYHNQAFFELQLLQWKEERNVGQS